jgi:hypothetical protein
MSQPHRAQHRQSEGDYYAETAQKLHGHGQDGQRLTEKAASDYSVAQGKGLQAGQNLRGDSPAPGENYANSPHEVLYDMVHKDLDIEGINDRSRVANVYGNWLADASNQFRDAATAAGGSWQGPAADQANGFFQNTAGHTEQTGNAMQLVSNHYSQQSAAASYAKNNMPEPTGFNQQAELDKAKQQYNNGDLIGMSGTMAGIQAKQQQADAAHQQAVQVLQNLDGTYHETASSQPTYAPPPQLGGSDSTSVSGFHGTSGTTIGAAFPYSRAASAFGTSTSRIQCSSPTRSTVAVRWSSRSSSIGSSSGRASATIRSTRSMPSRKRHRPANAAGVPANRLITCRVFVHGCACRPST